jgi:hypothetical protein
MPWRYMGEWKYSSTILDLGTRCRWVFSFTLRLLYPRGSRPRYPLARRLGGPQSRSGRRGEEKNLALPGIETRAVQPVAIPTELVTSQNLLYLKTCSRNRSLKFYLKSLIIINQGFITVRFLALSYTFPLRHKVWAPNFFACSHHHRCYIASFRKCHLLMAWPWRDGNGTCELK